MFTLPEEHILYCAFTWQYIKTGRCQDINVVRVLRIFFSMCPLHFFFFVLKYYCVVVVFRAVYKLCMLFIFDVYDLS